MANVCLNWRDTGPLGVIYSLPSISTVVPLNLLCSDEIYPGIWARVFQKVLRLLILVKILHIFMTAVRVIVADVLVFIRFHIVVIPCQVFGVVAGDVELVVAEIRSRYANDKGCVHQFRLVRDGLHRRRSRPPRCHARAESSRRKRQTADGLRLVRLPSLGFHALTLSGPMSEVHLFGPFVVRDESRDFFS